MHQTYACRFRQIPANMHKKVEKCQQETIAIDEVKSINNLATICLHKLDEVKCRKKLATICLQKSTFVRYYFSSILKIYVRQIKYLEMNRPLRF